jgi:hypothetical protein
VRRAQINCGVVGAQFLWDQHKNEQHNHPV